MAESRNIRLLRTGIGIVIGFLLMWAAIEVAYLGVAWFQTDQRILGIVVMVLAGPLLELCTHVIGIKTSGLGRGIIMGMFAGMIMGGRIVVQSGGTLGAAVFIPLFVFLNALFMAWVRERLALRKAT